MYDLNEINSLLDFYNSLDRNWDSYGAREPAQLSIDQARTFLNDIFMDRPRIIMSSDGYVVVKGETYSIEFTHSGPEIYLEELK